jgi:hypothetical protein
MPDLVLNQEEEAGQTIEPVGEPRQIIESI